MRIGLVVGIHSDGPDDPPPRWDHLQAQVQAAEQVGFDLVVLEDALYFAGQGMWESFSMAGALASATTAVEIGHSVINAPLRPAALIAKGAETLDEITNGRYVLGIGAGNTPDDYAAFDIPADPRVSRFAESIEIIRTLLRHGEADISGDYHAARSTRLYPRGPRPDGPPIVIAAGGPRMVDLAVRFGDGWNWWAAGAGRPDHLDPIVTNLEAACERHDRDPATLDRSLDVYSIDVLGISGDEPPPGTLGGSTSHIAETLLGLREFGIGEVRVDVAGSVEQRVDAVQAFGDIVDTLHAA